MFAVRGGLPGPKNLAFQLSERAGCSWNWVSIGAPPGYMNHEESELLSGAVTMG
jgi:hypothetical protein